ncbi:lysylphosphatidylglycerol synthase domain-containing protein [Candidatus Latescibacterota bacterium]
MTGRRTVIRAVQVVIVLAVILFLVRSVSSNWEVVRAFDWSFDAGWLTLSVFLFLAAYAMLPWIFGRVLAAAGHRIGFGDAWDIYFLGNLGRYLPGKVWVILGVSYLAGQRGIPKPTAAASAVFAQLYSLLSSIVFFFIFLIFTEFKGISPGIIWLLPAILVVTVASLFPKPLERMVNALLIRIGKPVITVTFSSRDGLMLTFLYFISWIVMGCAFGLLVTSVVGGGQVSIPGAAGMYVVAYAVGFFALFAPGGIGVREGILGVMLGTQVPVSVAILIAALARLLVTAIELLCVMVTVFRKGLKHGQKETRHQTA